MEHFQNRTSDSSQLEFRRKLTRDPDKRFDKLSSDGKVLVSSLRTALEEAKQRIVRLRDENDEKDDIIEEERSHRIALEEKMEKYLVDLYQNPSVNNELHQRLPRAKKKGLLFQDHGHEDEDHDAGSESSDVDLRGRLNHAQLQTADSSLLSQDKPQNQVDQSAGNGIASFMTTPHLSASQDNNTTTIAPVQTLPPSVASAGSVTAYPPFLGNQQPYYTLMYPYHQHLKPQPLASSSLTSLASSSYMGLPSVSVNNQGNQEERQGTSGQNAKPSGEMHLSAANNLHPHTGVNHPPEATDIILEGYQQTPVPPLNLNTPMVPMSLFGSGFIPTNQERQDNVSHITRLLQEISVLKKENRELKEELKEHKRDLELLKLNTDDDNVDKNTEAIYALIEEVKQAEKGGERAVSQLIQSANEDRNAALHELDRVRMKTAKRNLTLSSNSQTDGSFIEEIEENDLVDGTLTSDSENFNSESEDPRLASFRLEKLLERQKEITKQQIAAVTAQRDEALDKVNKLRKKLVSTKASEFPNATNQSLQAKLKITEKERDMAVKKLQLLSHDMHEVTLMYNLQKALLTDDVNIHSSNNHESSKWTNNRNIMDDDPSVDGLDKAGDRKEKPTSKFEAKFKSMERESSEKDKRIEKLEALVLRQRKKLNTLCAGPLLMED